MLFKFGVMRFEVLVVILVLFSCTEKAKEESFETVRMPQETKEFYIPTSLFDKLMIEDAEVVEMKKIKKVNEDETLQSSTLIFDPVVVELVEKNQDVLTHPRIRLEFPKGGGTVDLKKYKGERAGTFFVKFDFEGLRETQNFNIYYLSEGRVRKVDGMTVGSGCRVYLNVRDSVVKDFAHDGIAVNTTRDMHVSALAGHFIMSWLLDGHLHLTQVRFIDSSREDLICPPLRSGAF